MMIFISLGLRWDVRYHLLMKQLTPLINGTPSIPPFALQFLTEHGVLAATVAVGILAAGVLYGYARTWRRVLRNTAFVSALAGLGLWLVPLAPKSEMRVVVRPSAVVQTLLPQEVRPLPAPAPAVDEGMVTIEGARILRGGTPWHVVGANWAGIGGYGQNFGATAWFANGNGFSRHPDELERELTAMQHAGIRVVRMGLADDGRALLDAQGHVTGFNEVFQQDVQALLDAATRHGLQIEFALMDFHMAGAGKNENGVFLRGRPGVMADPALREEFRVKFLGPLLSQFGSHPALWGFDLLNEPEWLIARSEGGGWEDVQASDEAKAKQPISRAALEAFVRDMAAAIHQRARGKFVTVGVSAKFAALLAGALDQRDMLVDHLLFDVDEAVFRGAPVAAGLDEGALHFSRHSSPPP